MNRRAERGFTLIEVVVALAIVALGMFALFRAVGDAAANASHLRDRTFAAWVATDRIAELRLSGEFPSVEERDGEVELAGQRWRWRAVVSETPVQGLRRVDVTVRHYEDPDDAVAARATGFVGQAMQTAGPAAVSGWKGAPAAGGPPEEDIDRSEPRPPRPPRGPRGGSETEEP